MTPPPSGPPEDRDRLALRIGSLAAAVDLAEHGGATVVPIDVVRAHLGLPRPDRTPTARRTS